MSGENSHSSHSGTVVVGEETKCYAMNGIALAIWFWPGVDIDLDFIRFSHV